jgi:hypothetical protein
LRERRPCTEQACEGGEPAQGGRHQLKL